MTGSHVFALLLGAALLLGCREGKPPVSSVVVTAPSQQPSKPLSAAEDPREIPRTEQGHPQPKLPVLKLWVGTNEVSAEIASSLSQIMTGMMWRTNMAEMDGMLFVFGQPQTVGFWMRNTLLPLSCAYINSEGTILEIHKMEPRNETPITSQTDQVQYVLEMKQGWFERHGVKPGVLIATERGSFPQTFFRPQ